MVVDRYSRSGILCSFTLLLFLTSFLTKGDEPGLTSIIYLGAGNFSDLLSTEGRFELVDNIELNHTPWLPVGNQSHRFSAFFNGGGHYIRGLNVTTFEENQPAGLIGAAHSAEIYNLVLLDYDVATHGDGSPAAALVGESINSTIRDILTHRGRVVTRGGEFRGCRDCLDDPDSDHCRICQCCLINLEGGECPDPVPVDSEGNDDADCADVMNRHYRGPYYYRYSRAGSVAGYASGASRIENCLNTGFVNAEQSLGAGITGVIDSGVYLGNCLNTADLDTAQSRAAGIVARIGEDCIVTHCLNTGSLRSTNPRPWISGIAADGDRNITVSHCMNTGTITASGVGSGSGIIAKAKPHLGFVVEHNVNTGTIIVQRDNSFCGGIMSDTDGSAFHPHEGILRHCLNTGDVGRGLTRSRAGGIIGRVLNYQTRVSYNLNTGSVGVNGTDSYVHGVIGSDFGAQGGNNAWIQPFINETGYLTPIQLAESFFTLTNFDPQYWNNGTDQQYPMLKAINQVYQEALRINGTENGKNRINLDINQYAAPGPPTNESLLGSNWRVRAGYLPLLLGLTNAEAESAGIDCRPGGFACPDEIVEPTGSITAPASTMSPPVSLGFGVSSALTPSSSVSEITPSISGGFFTTAISPSLTPTPTPTVNPCEEVSCRHRAQTPGRIFQLLADRQYLHGFVQTDSGDSYWSTYLQNGNQISRQACCDVYSFPEVNNKEGILVDAVAYSDNRFHIAYHVPGQQDSSLIRFALDEHGRYTPEPDLNEFIPRPVDMFVFSGKLYLVTDEYLYTYADNILFPLPLPLDENEQIHAARRAGRIVYLLTEHPDIGWQIQAFDKDSGEPDDFFSAIPVIIAAGSPVTLQLINDRVHLLTLVYGPESRALWQTYSLAGSELSTSSVRVDDPALIEKLLILEGSQPDAGLSMVSAGADTSGQPSWKRLITRPAIVEITPTPSVSPSADGGQASEDGFPVIPVAAGSAIFTAIVVTGIGVVVVCWRVLTKSGQAPSTEFEMEETKL